MKKILLITTILIAGITFAQNNKFIGNYSTKSLDEIQKSIPENEKHEFYKQYFRSEIIENMKDKFNFKKYNSDVLKKFADSVIAGNTSNEIPENNKETIKKLDSLFDIKQQDSTYHYLAQNAGLFEGNRFPDVTSQPEESAIYETIPGEILTYVTENGFAAGRHFSSYRINENNLVPINPIPYDDKNFAKKISKYIKGNWRFEDRAGYEIKKQKNGEYLISTNLYLEDDANNYASKVIEYKTKNFKTFYPIRIGNNDENPKWKLIK